MLSELGALSVVADALDRDMGDRVPGLSLHPIEVNGGAGALFRDAQQRLIAVWALEIACGQSKTIRSIVNPDKPPTSAQQAIWAPCCERERRRLNYRLTKQQKSGGPPQMFTSTRRSQVSTTQETSNKAAIRRFHGATNTGDLELISNTIDELVEPDALIRTPLPIDATGAQVLKEVFARLLRVFPDLQVVIEDLIAEGDRVVSRNTVTGTQLGDYMGHPPTGNSVTYNEIFIFRFAGGRIAETWGVVDVLSQMRQVGVIPGTADDPHVDAARKAA